mgnify:CR=1 FL=1
MNSVLRVIMDMWIAHLIIEGHVLNMLKIRHISGLICQNKGSLLKIIPKQNYFYKDFFKT